MLQSVLFVIVASFLVGLIGVGIHSDLENVFIKLLSQDLSLTGLEGSWKVLAGFLILFYVPVAGLSFVSYMWNSGSPERRAEVFKGLKNTGVSLLLVSISFFLYGLVLSFVQSFTELSLYMVSRDESFRQSVFYSPFIVEDVDVWTVLNGKLASDVLFNVYSSGVYTLSLFLLIGTLGVQRVLARFGVLFLPLAVFLYNLPLSVFERYGLNIAKGLGLILFLPFLDILFLSVVSVLPRTGRANQVVYILSFLVIGLINWSVIKKVVLNPFKGSAPGLKGFRRFRVWKQNNSSKGSIERDGFYRVKNREKKFLKDLNRER